MSSLSIRLVEVLNILVDDEGVVKNLTRLSDELDVPVNIKVPLQTQLPAGVKSVYEYIKEIIGNWISRNGNSATVLNLQIILNNISCRSASDKLGDLLATRRWVAEMPISTNVAAVANSPTPENWTVPLQFGVTNEVYNFIGRKEELQRLNELLVTRKHPGLLISGPGGIGKTQIIKKFTHDLIINAIDRGENILVTWLSGESGDTLRKSLHDLGTKLGFNSEAENVLGEVQNKFGTDCKTWSKWIVVIDNVDEEHEEFRTVARKLLSFNFPFLVVTSRLSVICRGELKFLGIMPMDMKDSMEFLLSSLELDTSSEKQARKLCEAVGNVPLALQQIVACVRQKQAVYIKGAGYGLKDYWNKIKKSNESHGLHIPTELEGYSKTVLGVLDETLHMVQQHEEKGKLAIEIIQMFAYLNPDKIQVPYVYKFYNMFYGKPAFPDGKLTNQALELLRRYSLINIHHDLVDTVTIHRFVQLAVRFQMRDVQIKDKGLRICNCLPMFSKTHHLNMMNSEMDILSYLWENFDYDIGSDQIPHIQTIWTHTVKRNPSVIARFHQIPRNICELFGEEMRSSLIGFAKFNKKIFADILGNNHESTMWMEYYIAVWKLDIDIYDEEVLSNIKELEVRSRSHLGKRHRIVHECERVIGLVSEKLNNLEETLKSRQTKLQLAIEKYGENHAMTFKAKEALAVAFRELNRMEQVRKLYEGLLQEKRVYLGENHPSNFRTIEELGFCLIETGDLESAKNLLVDALPSCQQVLGFDHVITDVIKHQLFRAVRELGGPEAKIKLCNEILQVEEKALGPYHQTVLLTKKHLADLHN